MVMPKSIQTRVVGMITNKTGIPTSHITHTHTHTHTHYSSTRGIAVLCMCNVGMPFVFVIIPTTLV